MQKLRRISLFCLEISPAAACKELPLRHQRDAVRVRCKVGRAMLTDLAVLDGIDLVELEQPQAASDADAAVQAAIALLIANGYTITKNN